MIRRTQIVLLVFGALWASLLLSAGKTAPELDVPGITDAPPGGDFALQTSKGPFRLKDYRGKMVLLYFGYTKCPDVCPTSLSYMAQAFNELNDDELKKVVGVFVSVDPKRDTFELLDEYVDYFHPNFIGVTGKPEEIAKAAKLYGAQYYEVELKDSAFGYAVNHSAATYLIAPDGELRFIFPHGTSPEVISEAIRYVLEGK
ncbi:SCO family protein [Thiolapillus sp.]|uniref:SCO family protein n=1 Tax=Thiolapillus sp. TaxID=2017437 RepID=UPI003AF832F8